MKKLTIICLSLILNSCGKEKEEPKKEIISCPSSSFLSLNKCPPIDLLDSGFEIEILPYMVPCTNSGPALCMQIKKEDEDNYGLYNSGIEKFNYEWGYHYKLRVKQSYDLNFTDDGSDSAFRLVEEVSKEEQIESFTLSLRADFITKIDNFTGKVVDQEFFCEEAATCENFHETIAQETSEFSFKWDINKKKLLLLGE